MELNFKVYEPKAAWETLGTVKALAGKGGSIAFEERNWKNPTKNVAVIINRADGASSVVSCHKDLTAKLRAGEIGIKQLAGLNVIGTEDVRLIVLPSSGSSLQSFAVDNIKVEEVKVEKTANNFLPEELVAL